MHTFTRAIPCDDHWDVIVAGGGPAGCTAAIAAARAGRRVLLLEATSALGGMGTMGLIPAWCPFSDGEKIIYRGLAETVFTRSKAGMVHVDPHATDWVPIDPEHLKSIYDDLVTSAGVHLLFNTQVAAIEQSDGCITAVITAGKDGLHANTATVYVDGTGDADLAAWAGAPYAQGDAAGEVQPASLCFTLSNVDAYAYAFGNHPYSHLLHTRMDSEKYTLLSDLHLCNNLVGPGTVGFNAGHLWGVDNTDPASVTPALIAGRKIAAQFRDALAEYLPAAFANAHLVATAPLMGIRETRRIIGDYVLTVEDYLARRSFADEIGRNCYPVDIHTAQHEVSDALQGTVSAMDRFPRYARGESHGIPYRSLIPQGVKNVLVAGRSISTDRPVQASVRVMPVCLVTGEAAGMAAALACETGGDVRAVDVHNLRERLQAEGAYLP